MMAFKDQRILYIGRNNDPALTDVRATIRRNGTVEATEVALTAVSGMAGVYELVLNDSQIVSYGGAGYYSFRIDSASKSAPATTARWILENDSDTLMSEIEAQNLELASMKATLENSNSILNNGSFGLASLKTLIDSVQSAVQSIQNNTTFVAAVPKMLIRPETGVTQYKIPIRVYNTQGTLEDPDSNEVFLQIRDANGNLKNSFIKDWDTVAAQVAATRDSLGQYHILLEIPSTADLKQLNFVFSYLENGEPLSFVRTSEIVLDVQAAGFATQASLDDVDGKVSNIQSQVNSAQHGLEALKALLDTVGGAVSANSDVLTDSNYGLAALKADLDAIAGDLDIDSLKGAGYVSEEDSLRAISERLKADLFTGGLAI
jgi:hypothetical protein